jgi:hypothetical protein
VALPSNYLIILLLGSYDTQTEKLLQEMKDKISDHFMYFHETILVLLLDNLEVYVAEITGNNSDRRKVVIIAEFFDNRKKIGIYIIDERSVFSAEDIDFDPSLSRQETIRIYLEKVYTVD